MWKHTEKPEVSARYIAQGKTSFNRAVKVLAWLPTLTSSYGTRYKGGNLTLKGALLPTIGASEFKGSSKERFAGSPNSKRSRMSEGLRTSVESAAYLNPSFAEAVMGFPIGWSELSPSGTRSFQRARKPSAKP
jgi:hypothetical protein